MPRGVALVAAGVCPWGARKVTYREMITEAGKACFDSNKSISNKDVQGLILGSVFPERAVPQGCPTPVAIEVMGIHPSVYQRVENQCQTGTIAMRTGFLAIQAGLADVVMVFGAEKMLIPVHGEVYTNSSVALDHDWEQGFGMTPPALFALAAQAHMKKYGTTEEQMAIVSVKNHNHSVTNIAAHFRWPATMEQVMTSRPISYPFKLLDCCPNSDGAAAVILASEERARDFTDKPVWMLGMGQGFTAHTVANIPKDLSSWEGVRLAGERAYKMAGIGPDDVDLAEVHDCFTVSEIIETEELGFCKKGEGGPFAQAGQSDYGGKVVVNPRGGLIACGHPLGATGVAQACEVFWQLRGEAGQRQVKGAKVGLALTMSGVGTQAHAIIYSNVKTKGRRKSS